MRMSKIYNAFLKNTKLLTAEGTVQFDAECVAEVTNKGIEDIVLGLPNYHKLEEVAVPPETDGGDTEEPPVEEVSTEEVAQEPTETVEEKKVVKKTTTKAATKK